MAMMIKSGRGRGRRRRPMADINVTPMVDVMLVLLIVFMITAPMLATGVAVNLPKVQAAQLPSGQKQPLMVTLNKEGQIFVGTQKTPVELAQLAPQLKVIAEQNLEQRVYIRADAESTHQDIMEVLALLQRSGFKNAALPVEAKDLKRVDDILKNSDQGPAPEKTQTPEKGATPQ
ncbi:MAG TPA: biopolymer transporter ExbD [Hyphomonadaceae bacterium]|jgi:biopolymer transport protein TolR|nr:biopolymer transporter ExbD [Hyphomonadaceae bacterium]